MQENSYVAKMGMLLLSAGSRAQIHKKTLTPKENRERK
jgi:hypothetical protein